MLYCMDICCVEILSNIRFTGDRTDCHSSLVYCTPLFFVVRSVAWPWAEVYPLINMEWELVRRDKISSNQRVARGNIGAIGKRNTVHLSVAVLGS